MALGYYNSRFTVSRLFFPADAPGIRFSPPPASSSSSSRRRRRPSCPPPTIAFPFRARSQSLALSLESPRFAGEETKRERGGGAREGRQDRAIREVKPLLPKRIMRGKIKFFSTRPFGLHRPRDHALLLFSRCTLCTLFGAHVRPSPYPFRRHSARGSHAFRS